MRVVDADGAPEPPAVVLPVAVRDRVLRLASDRLGALPPQDVPVALRAFARFAAGRRARLAAVPLAAALETDPGFRAAVAEGVRAELPELAAALAEGRPFPAVPPADVATAAYLLRPDGWQGLVGRAAAELAQQGRDAAGAVEVDAVRRLTEQLEALRAAGRAEGERLREQGRQAADELVRLRRRLREMGDRAGRAEAAARRAEALLEQGRSELARERAQAQLADRRLEERAVQAEAALAAARQAAREGRSADQLRLRVLLDALLGAASGLRRELALAPAEGRPADGLAGQYPAPQPPAPARQGRDDEDPALLDALLGVPMTHLMVDGYNVTKGGFGDLSLEVQRGRLLAGLAALAARTGVEVTVVFDGAERVAPLAVPAPRGVRLLFSRPGETADEVLRTLARHEPEGRPVVVVSTDREVADGVRRSGARAVPSVALLRLLDRG